MSEIIRLIRDLINDNYKNAVDVFKYLNSNVFILSYKNINEDLLQVYVNEYLLDPKDYILDNIYNRITINKDKLEVNDVITIYYQHTIYSDNELISYISNALLQISLEGGFNYQYEDDKFYNDNSEEISLTLKEKRLIAFVASIIINNPDIKSYKTPEISITFADSMSKEDRIKMLVNNYKTILGSLDYCSLTGDDC